MPGSFAVPFWKALEPSERSVFLAPRPLPMPSRSVQQRARPLATQACTSQLIPHCHAAYSAPDQAAIRAVGVSRRIAASVAPCPMTTSRSVVGLPAIALELCDRMTAITLSDVEGDGERSP